jgi:UDP-N-acetyl-D-glucosamine dehydrogenase
VRGGGTAPRSVGVVGLGYVGLPLAVAFAQADCDVIAVDVDPRKIEAIRSGESYIEDVPPALLREQSERVHASEVLVDLRGVTRLAGTRNAVSL